MLPFLMPMNRILWVDDEIDLLQPYIIYLKGKNYEVVTASNGEDALALVESQKSKVERRTADWSGNIWTDKHPWQTEISVLDTLFDE